MTRKLVHADVSCKVRYYTEGSSYPLHSPLWANHEKFGRTVICEWCHRLLYETSNRRRDKAGIGHSVWGALYIITEQPELDLDLLLA